MPLASGKKVRLYSRTSGSRLPSGASGQPFVSNRRGAQTPQLQGTSCRTGAHHTIVINEIILIFIMRRIVVLIDVTTDLTG